MTFWEHTGLGVAERRLSVQEAISTLQLDTAAGGDNFCLQSKDNFWTTHPGSGADGASQDQTEVIVALLSKGPVGPSDGLAWLGNRSDWLKATCNADGALLQPSTPIKTIDATFSLDPGEKTVSFSHLYLKMIILPRHARY